MHAVALLDENRDSYDNQKVKTNKYIYLNNQPVSEQN